MVGQGENVGLVVVFKMFIINRPAVGIVLFSSAVTKKAKER